MEERRFPEAAEHFETAWTEGKDTVSVGTELVYALRASGNTARVEFYLGQMQSFLTVSPQLFDVALGSRSPVSFGDQDRPSQIATAWVESVGDADSYLRLARALLFAKVQVEPQRTQNLQQAETAYRKAIELDPKNPQSWGEFLRFIYREQNDPSRMLAELNTFSQNSEVLELDRCFVAAQLLSELGLRQPAARFWNKTVELVQTRDDKESKGRVLALAAAFFAGSDASLPADLVRATDLARQARALNPMDAGNLRLLTALLNEDAESAASLNEAAALHVKLREASQPLTDPDNRIMASTLYRRAELPAAETTVSDLQEAARLLKSVGQPTEADGVQLALVVGAQGDPPAALLALSEHARRTDASVPTIRAFVEYWQKNFSGQAILADRVQQALLALESRAGAEIVALELRLQPADLTSDEQLEIVRQFVTGVAAAKTTAADRDALLQQAFKLLAGKDQRDMSLQLLSEDLTPLTTGQKLTALVIASILESGSPEFEATLGTMIAAQIPQLDNAIADRAAADYYFMRANWKEAEQYYRKCLQRDAKDVAVINNLALVVAEQRGDFAEADALVQQCKAIMVDSKAPVGSDSFLLDTQSQLLLAAGKTEQAYAILVPLSQSVTADASVYLHLAECLHQMNKVEESGKAFDVATQLGLDVKLLPPMDKTIHEKLLAVYATQAKQ